MFSVNSTPHFRALKLSLLLSPCHTFARPPRYYYRIKEIKRFCGVLQWYTVRSTFREKRSNYSKSDRSGQISFSLLFSLFHCACCFNYFFTIPTNAHNIHTLKSTKIHIKTLNTSPYMFRSLFKTILRGLVDCICQITRMGSVDIHSL